MTTDPLRVLFCFGINQNFFELPREGITTADVWNSVVTLFDGIKSLPGIDFIGDIDDDAHMVGPSAGWPWTCYLLCDADTQTTVKHACNFLRTIPVGDGEHKLWKFLQVEARMGRALSPRHYED